jgi:striatin 1/3/4
MDTSSSHIVTGASDTVRLWDLKTRSCLSDFVAHRQKFDEGVTALRFHPSAAKFASGGGDGVVKIFN